MAVFTTNEHELVSRAIAGDRDSLSQLLYLNYDRLQAIASRKIPLEFHSLISADDVLQDAFVSAFRSIGQFEYRGPESFEHWLDVLLVNRLRDLLKNNRRLKRGGGQVRVGTDVRSSSVAAFAETLLPRDDASPSKVAAQFEAVRAVEVAIAELPDDQRAAIHLHYIDQLSLEQTADEMSRSPAAIRGLVHRGKQNLKQALGRSTRWFHRK